MGVVDPARSEESPCSCRTRLPLVHRISWGAGYPFPATAEDLESVHTRLEQPRVHQLPQIHQIPTEPQRSSSSSMYRRTAPPGRSSDWHLMRAQLGGFYPNCLRPRFDESSARRISGQPRQFLLFLRRERREEETIGNIRQIDCNERDGGRGEIRR